MLIEMTLEEDGRVVLPEALVHAAGLAPGDLLSRGRRIGGTLLQAESRIAVPFAGFYSIDARTEAEVEFNKPKIRQPEMSVA